MAPTIRWKILIPATLCLCLAVSGCGRRGPLETPSASTPAVSAPAEQTATGTQPLAPPPIQAKRGFFLDFLI